MTNEVDCFIHEDALYIIDDKTNNVSKIIEEYNTDELMTFFWFHTIINRNLTRISMCKEECIFHNYECLKNNNPELLI